MTRTGQNKRGIFRRKLLDRAVGVASLGALTVAIGAMLWILATLVIHGARVINWDFLIEPSKPYGIDPSGIANALLGTLFISLTASAIAIPVAIAGGIYLAEFGRNSSLGNVIRFSANVMMGMPSVLVGLFIYAIFVVPTGEFSGFAGALALSIIMIPVIMRTTEDMLCMVPDSLRESALALGMTRCRATLRIVCRTARGGLVTGILLAVARVSGETAPLLFTALWSDGWPTGFFNSPTANMPVLITEYATNSPFEEQHAASWGAALIITLIVLVINIISRILFREKKA